MTYLPNLIALAGVHLLAVASPGPAFVATVQLSVRQSRTNALVHSLGLGIAAVLWAAAVLLGLQAVMLQVAWLYRALQLAGGVYLLFIGWQSWRHAPDPIHARDMPLRQLTGVEAFRRGFATNIANPKVMVFFASIFAALLDPHWPFWVRLLMLTIIAFNETGWYAALALLLSTQRAQSTYRRAKASIDRIAGSCMMLFGGKLIWSASKLSAARN